MRLNFSAYCRNALRRVSLSLCPSFWHILLRSSFCCLLKTTLTMCFLPPFNRQFHDIIFEIAFKFYSLTVPRQRRYRPLSDLRKKIIHRKSFRHVCHDKFASEIKGMLVLLPKQRLKEHYRCKIIIFLNFKPYFLTLGFMVKFYSYI